MVVIKVTFYFMGTFNSSVMEKWRREREILSKLTSAGCLDLYRVCRWEALLGHTDLSLWLRGNDHNTKSTYVRKVCAYHCTLKWMLTIARWNLEHILKWSQYNEGKWATLNTGQLGWDGGSRYRFLLCHGPLRFLSKQKTFLLWFALLSFHTPSELFEVADHFGGGGNTLLLGLLICHLLLLKKPTMVI